MGAHLMPDGLQEQIDTALLAAQSAKASVYGFDGVLADLDNAIANARAQLQLAKDCADSSVNAAQSITPPRKTVRDFIQPWDGDDTASWQRAANTGSLLVPAGEYVIDPVKQVIVTLDGTVVRMDAGTVVRAKANSASRSYLLNVQASDCDIDCGGASLFGDRRAHTFTIGSWHEHGYGIFVSGARNKVRNVGVFECPGDGIGITGPDHEIGPNVVCRDNRRNGLSAFRSAGLWIHDSEFSRTGFLTDSTGLPGPFAGIDVEPDKGVATGIRIERCKFFGNQKAGIALWLRDEVDGGMLSAEIFDNEISGSPNCVWANDEAIRAPTISATILRNKLTFGSGVAIKADQGSRLVVGDANPANANTIDSATGSRNTAVSYGIAERRGGIATRGENVFL
jgi:hypothetical protein